MKHIWTLKDWKKNINFSDVNHRTGLRLKFDDNIDYEVRRACKEFAVFLRKEYYFPIRVPVYFKNKKKLRCIDGDLAYGTFFEPTSYDVEPYVRIAVADYNDLCFKWGKDSALTSILLSLAHELTHYFQWINGVELTECGYEQQATRYARLILDEYAETRDHP